MYCETPRRSEYSYRCADHRPVCRICARFFLQRGGRAQTYLHGKLTEGMTVLTLSQRSEHWMHFSSTLACSNVIASWGMGIEWIGDGHGI
jgi:hypothetical protein